MSSEAARKAWIVAAAIDAVEALKDQVISRWNYTIRSLDQHTKNTMRSFAEAKILPPSSAAASDKLMKKSEEKMRKVMDLSCLGPSTIRF
ncbi:hypothetical protein DITRI_Ditri01bG0160900 [Diplodiscus trichospermus]